MAYSGAQFTRLGLSATSRGLYGSFVGKTAEVIVAVSGGMLAARHIRRRMRRGR